VADYGTLQDIVTAIATEASQDGLQADGTTPITAIGGLERARKVGPPRVVWVPRSGTWEPAQEQQSEEYDVCAERKLECDVYLLGADYAAAETLAHAFGRAVFRSETRKAARVTGEDHPDPGLTGAERYEIRLTVEVDIPVRYREYVLVNVTTATQTGTIEE
jgi:hypothetical protein